MKKALTMRVWLADDTRLKYHTQGGQISWANLPKGTVLEIPASWVYDHVPQEQIANKDGVTTT